MLIIHTATVHLVMFCGRASLYNNLLCVLAFGISYLEVLGEDLAVDRASGLSYLEVLGEVLAVDKASGLSYLEVLGEALAVDRAFGFSYLEVLGEALAVDIRLSSDTWSTCECAMSVVSLFNTLAKEVALASSVLFLSGIVEKALLLSSVVRKGKAFSSML